MILSFVFYAFNTVCKFHHRKDLMISAVRCGEKNIHLWVSVSIIGQMSCKTLAYWISVKKNKNKKLCIPYAAPVDRLHLSVKHFDQYGGVISYPTTATVHIKKQRGKTSAQIHQTQVNKYIK